ncbi:MAG: CHAT domain-containing protein, partial [Candidatus Bipolaricaulia bacterium]
LALADPSHPDASPLPEACEEAQLIGKLFPEKAVYCGVDATEEMLQAGSATAQHLLLSTHGKFNAHNPMFSYLVLTPTEESDGKLHTYEVFGLPLRADLVVMSACETFLVHFKEMERQVRAVRGTGEDEPVELSAELLETLTAGDEIVGLTRAFISAGTPSVMSTLWEVVSGPTRELMVAFYGFLGTGLDLAEALRQAQLALLKDDSGLYHHPLYWAAFVPYGDWR